MYSAGHISELAQLGMIPQAKYMSYRSGQFMSFMFVKYKFLDKKAKKQKLDSLLGL